MRSPPKKSRFALCSQTLAFIHLFNQEIFIQCLPWAQQLTVQGAEERAKR